MNDHGLAPSVLCSADGRAVGLAVDIGSGAEPHYCLNACLDTAPFGDLRAWSDPPTAGAIRAGWLVGRGAADCKTAIAIFSHLGLELSERAAEFAGTLTLLFDADEHTGRFGGIGAYTASRNPPDGVMIGYPGLDEIVVGARGFWRGRLHVAGRSGHSGSRTTAADNAIVKAAALIRRLNEVEIPVGGDASFPLGPKITVTAVSGGDGYSVVPDRCVVSVDIRLTPRHDSEWAEGLVRELPETSRLAASLRVGARQALGREVPVAVAGPSNIGNFLATMGTEATCGFGVAYRNLHGTDEAIEVASIPLVYDAYLGAVCDLLSARR